MPKNLLQCMVGLIAALFVALAGASCGRSSEEAGQKPEQNGSAKQESQPPAGGNSLIQKAQQMAQEQGKQADDQGTDLDNPNIPEGLRARLKEIKQKQDQQQAQKEAERQFVGTPRGGDERLQAFEYPAGKFRESLRESGLWVFYYSSDDNIDVVVEHYKKAGLTGGEAATASSAAYFSGKTVDDEPVTVTITQQEQGTQLILNIPPKK